MEDARVYGSQVREQEAGDPRKNRLGIGGSEGLYPRKDGSPRALETRGGFGVRPEGICWASRAEDVTVSGLEAAEVPGMLSLREIWRIWGFLGVEGDQVHRWPRNQAAPGCRRQGSPAHQDTKVPGTQGGS